MGKKTYRDAEVPMDQVAATSGLTGRNDKPLTRQRIYQIERRALETLRGRHPELRDFLDDDRPVLRNSLEDF